MRLLLECMALCFAALAGVYAERGGVWVPAAVIFAAACCVALVGKEGK